MFYMWLREKNERDREGERERDRERERGEWVDNVEGGRVKAHLTSRVGRHTLCLLYPLI